MRTPCRAAPTSRHFPISEYRQLRGLQERLVRIDEPSRPMPVKANLIMYEQDHARTFSERSNHAAEEKKTVLRTTEEVREAALAPAEERHRKETVPRIEDEVAQAEIILLIQEEAKAVIRLETADRAAEDPVIMIRSQKIVMFLIMMMFMKNLWIHMMILKDASREKDRWTLKIWQIMMI